MTKGVKMRSLPNLMHGLTKSPLFNKTHEKYLYLTQLDNGNITSVALLAYTRMIGADGRVLPLSYASFEGNPGMIFHEFYRVIIWISYNTTEEECRKFAGISEPQNIPDELLEIESDGNKKIHEIVYECYVLRMMYFPVGIVLTGSCIEKYLQSLIVDKI